MPRQPTNVTIVGTLVTRMHLAMSMKPYSNEMRKHLCSLVDVAARKDLTDHPQRNVVMEQLETLVSRSFVCISLAGKNLRDYKHEKVSSSPTTMSFACMTTNL